MAILTILSPSEQVARHLEEGLRWGAWTGEMPGAPMLAAELGIDRKTAEAALSLLERRGLLVSRGAGRRRRIELPEGFREEGARPLKIGILLLESSAKRLDYIGELQHGLVEAGHQAFFSGKTMVELGMEVRKVRRLVDQEGAEAWVVVGGASGVLQWFSGQSRPTFALFGRYGGLPIAGTRPDKVPAYQSVVDRLVALGHRRIVLLARGMRRLPVPGRTEVAFLDRLAFHGIRTGAFNLPDWEDDRAGFQKLLTRLFQVTPPTALVIQEASLFVAAYHFLARRGLRVPENVSLVCSDDDLAFAWCKPSVSHIRWDSAPMVRRIVRWAAKVGAAKEDRGQTFTKAEFVEGETIGPAKR